MVCLLQIHLPAHEITGGFVEQDLRYDRPSRSKTRNIPTPMQSASGSTSIPNKATRTTVIAHAISVSWTVSKEGIRNVMSKRVGGLCSATKRLLGEVNIRTEGSEDSSLSCSKCMQSTCTQLVSSLFSVGAPPFRVRTRFQHPIYCELYRIISISSDECLWTYLGWMGRRHMGSRPVHPV